MYASGEYRRYAREAIVRASIINVISNRNIITNELYEQGLLEILKESEAAQKQWNLEADFSEEKRL